MINCERWGCGRVAALVSIIVGIALILLQIAEVIAVTQAYVIVSMIAAALYLGLALVIGGTSGLRAKGFPLNGLLGGISGVLLLGAVILLFGARFSAIVYGIFVGVFGAFVFMTFTSMICLVRQLTYRFE